MKKWRIPFNRPTLVGAEQANLDEVLSRRKFSGGGHYNAACNSWLRSHLGVRGVLMTTSCTHALEMAALLSDVQPSDEVVLPSYAFSSTATAFARCGARLKFVDCDPQTMNIDTAAVEKAITPRTKVIVALHYAGVSCNMQALQALADRHGLKIVEDAAQALFASYRGQPCGTFGDYGCYSFHETKNLHCGEGGALVLNRKEDVEKAEILLEKGTNRMRFFRGDIAKYEWVGMGSSYVPSELNTALLLAQLEANETITANRLAHWHHYREALTPLREAGLIELPKPPDDCQNNAHIFWIKLAGKTQRDELITDLKQRGIGATFHYVPLHSTPAGRKYGEFAGEDRYTSRDSDRLLRLPLFFGMADAEVEEVTSHIAGFFEQARRS